VIFKISRVGVFQRSSFLCEGLRFPKKVDLLRIPLVKSIAMLASMFEVLHLGALAVV
jgi:hypothetical protein